jgi:hypothetical protein
MLGSNVLKPRPTGTVWKAGGVANVSWYIAFNHGGGYKYRICPASEPLTEACFQKPEHQLEFASDESLVKFTTGDVRIKTIIEPQTGWALNPIPNNGHAGSTCDSYDGRPCAGCPTQPSMAEAAKANMTNIGCPGAWYARCRTGYLSL